MKQKKILYVTAECKGFVVTGGLAEVAGSLPQAIMKENKGYKVKVLMPLYKKISEEFGNKLKFVGATTVVLAWRSLYCGIFSLTKGNVEYYFVDNKYYFDRDNVYGYYDDGERFAFFSKCVFAACDIINYHPDIIHTNDWHTALVNVYLDILYKKQGYLMDIKSVFTIHNIEYQGVYGLDFIENVIGIDLKYTDILEYNGLVNLVKGAIVCSDLVTTVSPRYSREIATAAYACGLEHIIRINGNKVIGIINGIDTDFYNPETDKSIAYNYNSEDFSSKSLNKVQLQKELGLEENKDKCMIGLISRLVSHKGVDLLIEKFDELMKEDVQVVILGKGDDYYQNKFLELAWRYREKVRTIIDFNTNLSKKIYASCDLFLMPSKMEPCGLSQMIACRYGTLPIVRATGGLYDSIKNYENGVGNGFVFKDFDANQMLDKIKYAISVYNNKEELNKLIKSAMETDFSWGASAKNYIEAYKKLLA